MKRAFFLMVLMSAFSASAEQIAGQNPYPYPELVHTAEVSQDETNLRDEFYFWNGVSTEEDFQIYLAAGGRGMGPNSPYGKMTGKTHPFEGGPDVKWGPCTRAMIAPRPGGSDWVQTPMGWWRNPRYAVKPGGVKRPDGCARVQGGYSL